MNDEDLIIEPYKFNVSGRQAPRVIPNGVHVTHRPTGFVSRSAAYDTKEENLRHCVEMISLHIKKDVEIEEIIERYFLTD